VLNGAVAYARWAAALSWLWSTLALAAGDGSEPVLSTRAVLPAWVRALDADLVISADSIEWQNQELRAVNLPLALHGGGLAVRGATAQLAGGELKLDIAREAAGDTRLHVSAAHLVLGELPSLRPFVSGVPVDIDLDLSGSGDSLHALAASAGGRVQLRNSGPGMVRHGFEDVGDNLVHHFINAFEVFRRAGTDAYLECVAMDLPFQNGVAQAGKSMELRTRRLYVRGGGRVDLRDESVDLAFKPETRGTIKLQSLKVVEQVRVHGPLRAPEVTLDSAHLVGRAARLGLDVANLGGGAVLNRLLRRKPAPGLCGTTLAAPLTRPDEVETRTPP
jgi:hypothetical protein